MDNHTGETIMPLDLILIFNPDFKDFIHALNRHEVDYILIGGYAVILHGYARTTGDLDVFSFGVPPVSGCISDHQVGGTLWVISSGLSK